MVSKSAEPPPCDSRFVLEAVGPIGSTILMVNMSPKSLPAGPNDVDRESVPLILLKASTPVKGRAGIGSEPPAPPPWRVSSQSGPTRAYAPTSKTSASGIGRDLAGERVWCLLCWKVSTSLLRSNLARPAARRPANRSRKPCPQDPLETARASRFNERNPASRLSIGSRDNPRPHICNRPICSERPKYGAGHLRNRTARETPSAGFLRRIR